MSDGAPVMPETPTQILARFVAEHRLDPTSRIEVFGPQDVAIVYLRAQQCHHAHGGSFLRELVRQGWHVHVQFPLRAALPFWRRMRAAGLLEDDPNAIPTWEDYLESLEHQMTGEGV